MWPWEHAAVGYVTYSLWCRARGRAPPTDGAAVALAVGTQLPDLLDKPLAWWLSVLPAGRSLGHSLLFALPVLTVAYLVAARLHRADVGAAFAVGYLAHLPGDVIFPVFYGDAPEVAFLLYPLVPVEAGETVAIFEHVGDLVATFVAFLATPLGVAYLLAEIGLLVTAVWLWVDDGTPGLGAIRRRVGRAIAG